MLERGWLTSFWSHLSLSHCRLKASWFLASEHAQVISFEFHSSFSAITFQNDTRCPGCNVLNLLSPIQRIEGGKLLNELSQMGTELGKEIQQVLYRCGTLLSSLDSVKQMVGRVCDIFFSPSKRTSFYCIVWGHTKCVCGGPGTFIFIDGPRTEQEEGGRS